MNPLTWSHAIWAGIGLFVWIGMVDFVVTFFRIFAVDDEGMTGPEGGE